MSERRSPGSRRVVTACLLATAILLPAPPAAAGPPVKSAPAAPAPAAKDPAREHFDAAQTLYDQKKFDAALVLFRQAHSETRSPNAHLMVGLSLLALGRITEAYDELSATVREAAARAETEPKYASARDAAAAQIAPLEAKVGKLIVTLASPSADASVTVNGVALAANKLGSPVAVLPGRLEIVATRPGAEPLRSELTVVAGETKTVVLAAEKAAAKSPAPTLAPTASASVSAPGPTPDTTTGGGVRTAGFVVAGVGVAGMVAFAVGTVMADGKLAQLQKECGGVRCTDPKYADVIDSGKTLDLVATLGLGAGLAGLAGGTAMILFGGPRQAAPTQAATVEVAPGRAMLRWTASF